MFSLIYKSFYFYLLIILKSRHDDYVFIIKKRGTVDPWLQLILYILVYNIIFVDVIYFRLFLHECSENLKRIDLR